MIAANIAVQFLNMLGANARWVLAIGAILALFLPSLSAFLRPILPFLVSLVLAMIMTRMDILNLLRAILRPKKLAFLILMSLLLMPVTALFYLFLGWAFGMDTGLSNSLIYLAAAPPIASSAGLCFLLGFNAVLAVELTLVATLLTPIIGVATVNLLMANPPMIEPLALSLRLSWIIALGVILAMAARALIGPDRIDRNGRIFDGLAALTMLIFIVPLLDGVRAIIMGDISRAILVLSLAFVFNFGINLVTAFAAGKLTTAENAGALGILNGNRTVALYLAVVPPDPAFILFVALYQFPMFSTAVFGWVFSAAAGKRHKISQ